jgi:hypothetical protein
VVYTPLSNYKYDTGLHRIETGPNHEGFIVVSSGIQDTGADLGVITAGPPNSGGWYSTTQWRTVPQAASGYWTNYQNTDYLPSGSLSSYTGYRPLSVTTIANAKVVTSTGPEFGVRDTGSYNSWTGATPPAGTSLNSNYLSSRLYTSVPNGSGNPRSTWIYSPPVYCQEFTQYVRSEAPGLMSSFLTFTYRGKASNYVYNYGSVYLQAPESVRNMVHRFSPSVNSSNQRSI